MQLTIRARLFCLIAVMLVSMVVLGASGRYGMSQVGDGLQEVLLTNGTLRNHMEGDMMHDALRADVLAAQLAESPQEWQEVNANLKDHAAHFREMMADNNKTATGDVKVALDEVGGALDKYIRSAETIIVTAQSSKANARAMLPEFLTAFEELEGRLSAVSDKIEASASEAEKEAHGNIASANALGIAIFLLAAAIGIAVSTFMVRAITKGIGELSSAITHLVSGELGRDMQVHSRDECGVLLASLKSMDARFTEIVGAVRHNAEAVGSTSRQLSHGNDDLNNRTQEQAAALEETAASMEQMAATVKQNADNARAANQLAISARKQADIGGSVVKRAVAAMSEINSSSRKIGNIIGVIDEIAFQTNLLALNAAVEAARAGEQGRGFAVVASEVRNLAQRSAGAAKEIKDLIGESLVKVDSGSALVDESGRTIADIMTSVGKVTDIVAEIAAASEEQASGIEQVNRAVNQMDSATQQNAALVEEAAAASKSMEQLTSQLVAEVGFFKLQGGQIHSARSNGVAPIRRLAQSDFSGAALARAS